MYRVAGSRLSDESRHKFAIWRMSHRHDTVPAIMGASYFFLGPDRNLTSDELEALMNVKAGVRNSEWFCTKLEAADLIEKGLGGWQLTRAGEFRLTAKR
jgi:hypothetical protein